jgi:hypothetical protein
MQFNTGTYAMDQVAGNLIFYKKELVKMYVERFFVVVNYRKNH